MENTLLEIGADGIDTAAAIKAIRERLAAREKEGFFSHHGLERVSFLEIKDLKDDTEFLRHLVSIMKKSWEIDINEFDFGRRPGLIGAIESGTKKIIWKLLRFYTFRMFTQQREFNAQASAALGALLARLDGLEERLRGPKR